MVTCFLFFKIITPSLKNDGQKSFPIIEILPNAPYRTFFDSKLIDIGEYNNQGRLQIRYLGLKANPLYLYEKNTFMVLNWNFLYSQIYLGVLFDFYNNSGINEVYSSFQNFKGDVGKLISEGKLFQAIITSIFNKRYDVVSFGLEEKDPDAYIRRGKYLYLFEFKDTLFPDKQIQDSDFEGIRKEIEKKFFQNDKGKPKGVRQLVNHIKFLEKNTFKFDDFTKKLKRKNLVIVPIIVVNNQQYTFPGVNYHLNQKFEEIYKNESFNKVLPITVVSLDYLFENIDRFNEYNLHEAIKEYFKKLNGIRKSLSKRPEPGKLMKAYSAIEFTQYPIYRAKIKSHRDYDKILLKLFDLANIPS